MIVPDWAAYLHWRPRFAEAMDPVFYTPEYLDDLILAGRAMLWLVSDAAMVTEIREYPGGARVIHGLVAAGELATIVNDLIPEAEVWAKAQGCSHAMIESREGWARALKLHGYEVHQVSVVKGL